MRHFVIVGVLIAILTPLIYHDHNSLQSYAYRGESPIPSGRLDVEYGYGRHILPICPDHGASGL